MEGSSPDSRHSSHFFRAPNQRSVLDEESFWRGLGTIYRWRKFILSVTAGVAVVAIVLSLLLPVWFKATTRLLTPGSTGRGNIASVLGDFAPEAASFLGATSSGGETNRYFAILTSRSMMQRVIEEFDLVDVYETGGTEAPLEDAIEVLRTKTEFVLDQEYEFIAVEVYDKDPHRAADMANFFVTELNRINSELSARSASQYTNFIERSLREAETSLDTARAEMQRFQERHGVIDLPTQTQSFLENLADLRRDILAAEIRHEVLAKQLGPDNAQTESAKLMEQTSRSKYDAALAGSERLLPVPQAQIPSVANEYASLMQELLIQTEIVKFVRPLYEQARFDEQREKVAVQVLDPAVPPSRKAKPVRTVIVIVATVSASLLAVMFALFYDWLSRERRAFIARLKSGATTLQSEREA